jgi:thioesterase domain-containing protein
MSDFAPLEGQGSGPAAGGELEAIERLLHEQIPITRAMGVRVVSRSSDGGVILEAPLEANHNHLHTAFGGSLGALLTLSGYTLLWLEVGDPHCHIVIRDSRISFRRPVKGNLRAICRPPEAKALETFHAEFRTKGRARIELQSTIEEDGGAAVVFHGTFVALK